jgi:hypothetical protein
MPASAVTQDAELYRVAPPDGMHRGELLALGWEELGGRWRFCSPLRDDNRGSAPARIAAA